MRQGDRAEAVTHHATSDHDPVEWHADHPLSRCLNSQPTTGGFEVKENSGAMGLPAGRPAEAIIQASDQRLEADLNRLVSKVRSLQ